MVTQVDVSWAAPADDGITKLRLAPVGFQRGLVRALTSNL